ncbi:MAG: SEC-C metal-binding domain-containing protein [Saprospiraceae bacterium]
MTEQEYLKVTDPELIAFGEKLGLRITDHPTSPLPEEIEQEVDIIYSELKNNPQRQISKLKNLIEKYPEIVSLRNHLFLAYHKSRKKEQSFSVIEEILEKFPDNIFARANRVILDSELGQLEKHIHLLGDPREIQSLLNEDRVIHVSEFRIYHHAAAIYEVLSGEEERAKERLRLLMEMGRSEEVVNSLAQIFAVKRLQDFQERREEMNDRTISVEPRQKFDSGSGKEPVFQHDLVKALLYNKSVEEITEEEINQLVGLPRESLIADLEKVVMDSIHRWEEFGRVDFEEHTHCFLHHALNLLGGLKATESLETVLNCLRMGEGFTEYWFGDYADRTFQPVLYNLGHNQLEKLKRFVLEGNIFNFDRIIVSQVVAQIGLHHPERRAEVLEWFIGVLSYHLEFPDDDTAFDTIFLGFTISVATDLRDQELLPLIKELDDDGWLLTDIEGDLEHYRRKLKEPIDPYDIEPMPQNVVEFYTEEYLDRRAPMSEEHMEELEQIKATLDDPVDLLIGEKFMELTKMATDTEEEEDFYEDSDSIYGDESVEDYLERLEYRDEWETPEPIVRSSPKVGRNDPCPCGSGKKYKKCCL